MQKSEKEKQKGVITMKSGITGDMWVVEDSHVGPWWSPGLCFHRVRDPAAVEVWYY